MNKLIQGASLGPIKRHGFILQNEDKTTLVLFMNAVLIDLSSYQTDSKLLVV